MYQFQQQQYQYVDDDLPLPSYDEVFSFLLTPPLKQTRTGEMNQLMNLNSNYNQKHQQLMSTNNLLTNKNSHLLNSLHNRNNENNSSVGAYNNRMHDNSMKIPFESNRNASNVGSNSSHLSNDTTSGGQKKRKSYNKKLSNESDSSAG